MNELYEFKGGINSIEGDNIGISGLVDYCPLYICYDHTNRNTIEGNIIYYKPTPAIGTVHISTYNDLIKAIFKESSVKVFGFMFDGNPEIVDCGRGFVQDRLGNILLLFTVKSEELTYKDGRFRGDFSFKDDNYNQISENIKLFVSTVLVTEKKYTNLYKRLDKEIISRCYADGIAVEFTTSKKIDDTIYRDGLDFAFNTINELNTHLENDIPAIFNYEQNLYNVFSSVSLE